MTKANWGLLSLKNATSITETESSHRTPIWQHIIQYGEICCSLPRKERTSMLGRMFLFFRLCYKNIWSLQVGSRLLSLIAPNGTSKGKKTGSCHLEYLERNCVRLNHCSTTKENQPGQRSLRYGSQPKVNGRET